MTIEKNQLIELCKNHFKDMGYKKKNNSWFKYSKDFISCFNIQTSQWNSKEYYINVGIVIVGIDDKPKTALGTWHFHDRIDNRNKSIKALLFDIDSWLEKHSDMDYLRTLAKMDYDNRLPVLVKWKAVEFLTV